ncbi:MAG: c-type cytochrome [Myxococcus sp.]|nr:c-type cytochrome [Myxococcus sp.]
MKKLVRGLAAVLVVLLVVGGAAYAWARSAATTRLTKKFETHRAGFPVPFPLTEAELAGLRAERAAPADAGDAGVEVDALAGVDLAAIALERARARGKHLVESIYPCIECHGVDFAGGTMVDSPPVGRIFGMNLTRGKGGVVEKYTPADWDRMVRHGVKPDGTPTSMPSGDFVNMSDRELSDIVAYIQSMPPVDREVPRPQFGPVGLMLLARAEWPLDGERVDHQQAHKLERPDEKEPLAYGEHLTRICTGCHGVTFVGGPIPGSPPDWLPAANITPHADGIAAYSFDDFKVALREGKGKGGRTLGAPMNLMGKYGQNMSEAEIASMWAYLQTVPPLPSKK